MTLHFGMEINPLALRQFNQESQPPPESPPEGFDGDDFDPADFVDLEEFRIGPR